MGHIYFLITVVIAKTFIHTAGLGIPAGIPIKEEKAEIETKPSTTQADISKCSV